MATDDFFRARLDGMVDPQRPLAVLARRLPLPQIEASLAPLFTRKARPLHNPLRKLAHLSGS